MELSKKFSARIKAVQISPEPLMGMLHISAVEDSLRISKAAFTAYTPAEMRFGMALTLAMLESTKSSSLRIMIVLVPLIVFSVWTYSLNGQYGWLPFAGSVALSLVVACIVSVALTSRMSHRGYSQALEETRDYRSALTYVEKVHNEAIAHKYAGMGMRPRHLERIQNRIREEAVRLNL